MPANFRSPLLLIALLLAVSVANSQAGLVRLLDGRSLEGALRFNDSGALVVTPAEGEAVTVDLKTVSIATFASGSFFSSGSVLPNGWTANDFGETRGLARLDTNTFTFRVEGLTTNATACHFVSRPMLSDGEMIVRVEDVSGSGLTHAGIMIRGQNSSVFVALSVGSDGKLSFQRRADPEKREVRTTAGPKISLPVWLRLQKKEKTVTALYARDGKTWETLATDSIKLLPEKTWREGEGDLRLLRATCGVFASSRGVDVIGKARVAMLLLTQNGLVGEYFSGGDFANLKMARFDPQIRFNWRESSPDPALTNDDFSVRWTGKLVWKKPASFSFHIDADTPVRLWIDGKEIPHSPFKSKEGAPPPKFFALHAGVPHEFRLEYEHAQGPAAIKLGWAQPYKDPEVIGHTNFLYHFTGAKSPESIALSRMTNAGPVVRGIVLRNGTFLAANISKADVSAVRVAFAGRKEAPVLNNRVARIVLRPPRQPLGYELAQGRGGVFMKNGDFFESDFRGIEHNSLTISSVLFGLKKIWIDGGDAVVVVINDVTPANSGFEVRLLDGSVLRAVKVTARGETIEVEDSILGRLEIPAAELVEIQQLGISVADTTAQ